MTASLLKPPRFKQTQIKPQRTVPDLVEDARAGLLKPPRSLPPKYFYDSVGSELFDRICSTPEYYVTRTEARLLERVVTDIAECCKAAHVLEFGSGAARKTGQLLAACRASGLEPVYWPFEVCEAMLKLSSAELLRAYPWLHIHALCGDYTAGLQSLPDFVGPVLYVFLGSSIGNYGADEASRLLAELRTHMRPGDFFLLGADRVKDVAVLDAAYNDAAGITAEFNLNVLRVLNGALGADFELAQFEHEARYDAERRQIEMYLKARVAQTVRIPALRAEISIAAGERILTEISRKYELSDLESLLRAAGLKVARHYEADDRYFSLLLAQPA